MSRKLKYQSVTQAVAAYRADIEIGVVGAARLKELQDRITKLSRAIDDANVKTFIDNKAVQSLGEYSGAAGKAAANLRETAIQLNAAGKASGNYADAISQLVTAVGQENSALKIQNNLIKEEIELRRKAKLAASGIRETTQYAGPIGPGQASPVSLRSELRGRTQQILDERKGRIELNAVLQDQFEVERQLQNNKLDEKAARVQAELDKQAAAAAESAAQVEKLTLRQAEFTSRTDAAAQAAARQTAAFYKQARIAKEVAKINAAAGPAQLLLAPAAPGAPAMGGGARRRITGQVERLGGARTADEAAATLRLAQATDALVQSSSKIDPQYNRFLPDTAALNATGRGIQRLTTNQEEFNQAVQRGIRFEEKYNQELERRRRLGIGGPATNRMPGVSGVTGGPFPVAGPIPLSQFGQGRRVEAGAALRGRAGGALGNALIGGAFPLLFGQGGGAALGGAIGGLAGGAFGGVGGFAGSLVGTLIGDIASRGQAVKQLADDIGFSAQQTKQLSDAFKVANTDVEKFTAVIQNIRGVGLEIEDQAKAIQLVTRLTELYGGSFEKTGNAITSALEGGKVTQAILNQLTSQGINIQQALADKYRVNRDAILAMAKDGEISVQDLVDTLVVLGNSSDATAKKQENVFEDAYEQITSAASEAATTATNSFTTTGGTLQQIAADIQSAFTAMFGELVRGTAEFISGLGEIARIAGSVLDGVVAKFLEIQYGIIGAAKNLPVLDSGIIEFAKNALAVLNPVGAVIDKIRGVGRNRPQQFGPEPPPVTAEQIRSFKVPSQAAPTGGVGAKGPKPPEDRTPKLLADLDAMKLISITQDGIRDALFEGNKELAIRLDYDQKVYDIQRDTANAIREANYESEKAAYRAQEIVRIKDAQLERDDQLRDLAKEINETILNTLDDLRGGVTWDDTGLRAIFNMTIPDAINEARDSIEQLSNPMNQIVGAATAISSAFAESFRGIVSGAVSAKEGLRNFFKSVGDYFIDMAARIAAEALKLQAIQLISSLFSSALGSFASSSMTLPGLQGAGALTPGISTGAAVPSYGAGVVQPLSVSPQITPGGAFAEGGFVTGPTRALIGEGGESEYVIPASKMRGAMARYAAGARGSAVIPGNGTSGGGGAVGSGSGAIDVRYTVERINSVDYVTADQFQKGMAQAARQGAEQGERRALGRLRNSPTTRNRVGV